MRLTKKLKSMIVKRFTDGVSLTRIAIWYDEPADIIEQVIREHVVVGALNKKFLEAQREPAAADVI